MLLPVMDATVEVPGSAARLKAAAKVTGTEARKVKCLVVLETLEFRADCKLELILFIFFLK
jgi:hypothetical protein